MADDEYDDLYGDLYPGEAEYGSGATASTGGAAAPAAAPGPSTSTSATSAPTAASPAPATSAIPSFADGPRPSSLPAPPVAAAAAATNPPLHFSSGTQGMQQPQRPMVQTGVRPNDMPEEGKMFIGGLNWDTTDDSLKSYFEQFGPITHCTIMRDSETGRSRGFAFLTFENPSSVNAVMAREHHLDGKTIDPKRAIPRSETAKTDKLFVRALPATCTQESFRQYWRQFGPITDATLMMDKETGRHRGFGFVNYETREAVEKVLNSGPHYMDGQMLEVKRAQAKGEPRRNDYGVNTNQQYTPQPYGGAAGAMGGGMAGGMGGAGNMGMNAMGGGAAGAAGAGTPFDPAAMSKFFAQMGWGGFNPMMLGGMGGGMGGFNSMGMGAMGGFNPMGMGFGMPGMGMGGMGSPTGADGAAAAGGAAAGGDGAAAAGGDAAAGQSSPWTAPMAAPMSMRGGRGGATGGGAMRGGGSRGGGRAGFNPPTGPASMRDEGGAGPQRSRGSGAGFHPYSR